MRSHPNRRTRSHHRRQRPVTAVLRATRPVDLRPNAGRPTRVCPGDHRPGRADPNAPGRRTDKPVDRRAHHVRRHGRCHPRDGSSGRERICARRASDGRARSSKNATCCTPEADGHCLTLQIELQAAARHLPWPDTWSAIFLAAGRSHLVGEGAVRSGSLVRWNGIQLASSTLVETVKPARLERASKQRTA